MNAYQRELDLAVLKVATGTFAYDQVVKDCVHRLAQSGLCSINYASGRSYQLDTAARMCVRTGCSQLAGKIMEENLKSTGQDLVITSQHMGSRPEHAPWQNKVFSYSGKSKKYPDFFKETGYGTVTGLKGANCTHDFYPFWEGISVIPEDIKVPDPVTINGKTYTYYECTQKQRSMERDIRALKREINASEALGMDSTELRSKLKLKTAEYKQFSVSANLRAKENRLRVQAGTETTSEVKKYQKAKKTIEKTAKDDTIIETKEEKVIEVHSVGKINREIYKCVTEDIVTDEVIITNNQIQHILERHPEAYESELSKMQKTLEEPDYILGDNKHKNTGLVIKNIVDQGVNIQLVLRICTSEDPSGYKNSIISCWKISDKRLQNYLRNKQILYKKE